jgi:hypothetical protein
MLAGGVEAKELLGSYRGLYCYTNNWNHALTGGVTIVLFAMACLCTAAITALAHKSLSRMDVSAQGVVIRGMSLIASLFITWFIFCVAGFMRFINNPPSVDFEM